jgi:hypothetical protein
LDVNAVLNAIDKIPGTPGNKTIVPNNGAIVGGVGGVAANLAVNQKEINVYSKKI